MRKRLCLNNSWIISKSNLRKTQEGTNEKKHLILIPAIVFLLIILSFTEKEDTCLCDQNYR
jgi:hypothetical protein